MSWQWQRWAGLRATAKIGLRYQSDRPSSRAYQTTTSLFFFCQNSLGNVLLPQVKKGDQVKVGSVLATLPDPFGQPPLFSPVAGKVVDITYRPGSSSQLVPVIAIEPATPGDEPNSVEMPELPSSETRLQSAAAYAGLDLRLFHDAKQLVVNGCDPDLGLYSRSCLLRERLADVLRGATALAGYVGGGNVYLAISRGQLTAGELEALKRDAVPLQLLLVSAGYPAVRPEILVSIVIGTKPTRSTAAGNTGGRFPGSSSPGLYSRNGVMVVGVERVAALGYALGQQRPPADVMVSVDGDAVSSPGVYRVPVGTPLPALLDFAGLNRNSLHLLIRGGYLTGQAIPLDDAVVGVDDIGFLALTSDRQQSGEAGRCLHCGKCLDVCPAGLSPTTIARLAKKNLWSEAALAGAGRCFGCGLCAYVCPADLPLVQLIRLAQLQLEYVK